MMKPKRAAILLATLLFLVAGVGQADGNERHGTDSSNQCPAGFPTWLLGAWHQVDPDVDLTDYRLLFEEEMCWGMARFDYYAGYSFYFDYNESLGWYLRVAETAPCRIIEIVELDSQSVRIRVEYTGDPAYVEFSGWVYFHRRTNGSLWIETESHMRLILATGSEWHFWKASGP